MARRRVDLVELALIVVLTLVAGIAVGSRYVAPIYNRFRASRGELDTLSARYGPDRASSHEEEYFVRDFFRDRRDGVFLDVGAGDYREGSNTYFLERQLGWSGIAVDALAQFGADYARFRPHTKFFALFVSDVSGAKARLSVGTNTELSSGDARFTRAYSPIAGTTNVPTVTLNQLLDDHGIRHLDFVSMDIELSEPKALAGFDIERFRPALLVVEDHPEVRQAILDYFQAHQYVAVGRYLRADPQNLWFAPVGDPLPPPLYGSDLYKR